MWHVYILQSKKDQGYYVGCTSRLETRLEEHNKGQNKSTRNRAPFMLVYSEQCQRQIDAFAREQQIKAYKGGNAFKRLLGTVLK
jgi:putative endonuclease